MKMTPFLGANPDYLGDGLYAGWQDDLLVLAAERENGWHWVGLEPAVLQALLGYIERVRNVTITVVKRVDV